MSAPIRKYLNIVVFCLLFTAFLVLAGCANTEKLVVKHETTLIETPRHLLKKCDATQPPSRKPEDYAQKDPSEKEKILANHIVVLYGDIKKCNDQISEVAAFQEREKANLAKIKAEKDK